MSRTRAAVLTVLAVGLAAAAIAIAIGVAPVRPTTGELARRPVPVAMDPVVLALSDHEARLAASQRMRGRLEPARRDPFRFQQGASTRAAGPVTRQEPALPTRNPEPTLPARPLLVLAGIAEDGAEGARTRTAIVSTADQLYLVREGERLDRRFEVIRITATEVQVRDVLEQTVFTLTLR